VRRWPLGVVLIAILPSVACSLQSKGPTPRIPVAVRDLEAKLDAQVPAWLARYRVGAAGVALIADGVITLAKVYGRQAPDVPASTETLFNVASLTKPVTAEVVLRLTSAGLMSLDEPIARFWIDPDIADDLRRLQLTPRLALTHQTGLPNWRGNTATKRLTFLFDPGTAFGYSGEGYEYVARFAEKKLGKNFEALAQEYLFGPVGMTSTSYSARAWIQERISIPTDSNGRFAKPQIRDEGNWNAPNNLLTTVTDYAHFMVSVMKGDMLGKALATERVLPSRNVAVSACQATSQDWCPDSYGFSLGWAVLDYKEGPVLMHTGANTRSDGGGERAVSYLSPVRRSGVLVLTSGSNGLPLYLDVLDLVDPRSPVAAFLRASR